MIPLRLIQEEIQKEVDSAINRAMPTSDVQPSLEVLLPTTVSKADGIYIKMQMTEGVKIVDKASSNYNNYEMYNERNVKEFGVSFELYGMGPSSEIFLDDCMFYSDVVSDLFYNTLHIPYMSDQMPYETVNEYKITGDTTNTISSIKITGRQNQRNAYYVDSDTWKMFYTIAQISGVTTFTAYRDTAKETAILQGTTTAIHSNTTTASISLTGTIDYTSAGSTYQSLKFVSGLSGSIALTYTADSTGELHITNNSKKPFESQTPGFTIIFDPDNIESEIFQQDNVDNVGRDAFIFSVTYNAVVSYADGTLIFNRR